MPKTVPVQDSFAAGEISERFLAQMNHPAYKNGARSMINWMPKSQGPAGRRHGMEYIYGQPGSYGRSFDFPITADLVAYALVTDDGNIWMSSPDNPIFDNNEITNGNFYQGATGWTDVALGSGYNIFKIGSVEMMPGKKEVTNHSIIRQSIALVAPDQVHELRVAFVDSTSMCRALIRIGTASGQYDLFESYLEEDERKATFTFDPQNNPTIWLDIYALDNDEGNSRVLTEVIMRNPATGNQVNFASPWSTAEVARLQTGMPPGEDAMFFMSHSKFPRKLIYDRSTDAWTFISPTFTGKPSTWTSSNYPGTVTFFQGRMWVGGTPNEPEQFWASKSADFLNFTTGSLPDDALSFVMAEKGAIKWMVGAKNLLIGTGNGEHICTSEGNVIKPGDIQVDQQSANGSAYVQPVKIGNHVLYVSPDRRKVREMGYKWTDDGWVSRDITYVSEHITKGNLIQHMCFAQNPNNLILASTQKGQLIGAVYERNNDVVGWFNIHTDGRVTSVSTVKVQGKSLVGLSVNRDIEATSTVYFESLFTDREHTDSHVVERDLLFAPYTITVPHLKNKTVQVMIDGARHPDVTLNAAGQYDLTRGGNRVVVGLPYHAYLRQLPMATTLQIGQSTMPYMKRYNKIFVRVYNSSRPKINGTRPPTRHPETPLDTPEPLETVDLKVTNLGWSQDGGVIIEQDLPLETNVAGLFGETAQEIIGSPG